MVTGVVLRVAYSFQHFRDRRRVLLGLTEAGDKRVLQGTPE